MRSGLDSSSDVVASTLQWQANTVFDSLLVFGVYEETQNGRLVVVSGEQGGTRVMRTPPGGQELEETTSETTAESLHFHRSPAQA